MPFVLDASVSLAWCFREEENAYTNGVRDRITEDTAIVSAIWPLEVTNALLMAERRGRLTSADLPVVQRMLSALPIEQDTLTLERVFGPVLEIARAHNLSAYDASYLELAMREGLSIATQDTRLRSAANRLGVTIAE